MRGNVLLRISIMVFLGIVSLNAKSQEKKRMLLELSGNPIETSFEKNNYAASFNVGVSYFVAEKLNIGLQFHDTYEFNKDDRTYNSLSTMGVSAGYNLFTDFENSFWEDGSLELMADIGGGYSNFDSDMYFFYGSLSCRLYFKSMVFVGVGYNHKWHNEDAINYKKNSLFFVFGFRL